jgi:hypothetical protein
MRRLLKMVVALVIFSMAASPAAAGGSWLYTVEDSYDPGDEVTVVGYVGAAATMDPVLARINVLPMPTNGGPVQYEWVDLGPVTMETTGLSGYLETRVSVSLTLPNDLTSGIYAIEIRGESGAFFGDLIGADVFVGVEPDKPRWIEWPLDEPLIHELPDEDIIAGPGFAVPAGDLKEGNYPGIGRAFMLHPENLPEASPGTSHASSPPDAVIEDQPATNTSVGSPAPEKAPASKGPADVDLRERRAEVTRNSSTVAPEVSTPDDLSPGATRLGDYRVPVLLGVALIAVVSLFGWIRRRAPRDEPTEVVREAKVLTRR